jgi:hypothetical protein
LSSQCFGDFFYQALTQNDSGQLIEYAQFLGDLQDLSNRGLRLNTFVTTPSVNYTPRHYPFPHTFEEDGENRLGFAPASDHPRYKAKLIVHINDLELSVLEKAIFVNLLGPRYCFKRKQVAIVSRHFGDKVGDNIYILFIVFIYSHSFIYLSIIN